MCVLKNVQVFGCVPWCGRVCVVCVCVFGCWCVRGRVRVVLVLVGFGLIAGCPGCWCVVLFGGGA